MIGTCSTGVGTSVTIVKLAHFYSDPVFLMFLECVMCAWSSRIFGHHGNAADDIIYINWLNMVRAGLLALEFYTPETQAWKQVTSLKCIIIVVILLSGE